MPRDKPRNLLAFDIKTSMRHKDDNGFLHVKISNITKEQIAPYYGYEIPNYQELGLDPNGLYYMYRPAEELMKAAPTFNGIPLAFEHHYMNAQNLPKEHIIGSLGTDAEFRAPYLTNSLIVTDGAAIEAIERGDYTQLSAAYHYTPVMSSGIFNGEYYDGRMYGITANHVALVHQGRAGADVAVADGLPEGIPTQRSDKSMEVMVNLGAFLKALKAVKMIAAGEDPRDAGLEVDKTATVQQVVEMFFADADESTRGTVILQLEDIAQHVAENAAGGVDAPVDPNAEPAPAEPKADDGSESAPAGEAPVQAAAAIVEGEGEAKDDPPVVDPVPAPAIEGTPVATVVEEVVKTDAEREADALKALLDEKIAAAKAEAIEEMKEHYRELNIAAQDCRPVIGVINDPFAFDSASDIYKKALTLCGVDVKGIHESAFPALLKMARGGMKPIPAAPAFDNAPTITDNRDKTVLEALARINIG